MPNIGPLELAIVLIIALVIFGPKRLPELGRSVGHGLREFKASITGEDKDDEPRTIDHMAEDDEEVEEPITAPAPSRADTPPASTTGQS
jgi:sec-independent protein translocase protein TatA